MHHTHAIQPARTLARASQRRLKRRLVTPDAHVATRRSGAPRASERLSARWVLDADGRLHLTWNCEARPSVLTGTPAMSRENSPIAQLTA
jgi:hypothetical protein